MDIALWRAMANSHVETAARASKRIQIGELAAMPPRRFRWRSASHRHDRSRSFARWPEEAGPARWPTMKVMGPTIEVQGTSNNDDFFVGSIAGAAGR
jgi:hypothetical protein